MNTVLNIDTSRTEASIYNLIDVVDKELLSAPKGYIRLESSKGYPRYYYYRTVLKHAESIYPLITSVLSHLFANEITILSFWKSLKN